MRTICDDRSAAIPPPSTDRRHKSGTAAPGGCGAAEMLQAVDQRSASSAGLAPTGAEGGGGRCGSSGRCCNAPRALLHIAARPDARIAANCCSRTARCSNGTKAGPDRPRSIFAARLPQTVSNGQSDLAVSLRISTRKKISGYDRHETNPNLLLVQEVPGL